MISTVTGVILAGGKSSRMGSNKAFLPYRGRHLIDSPIATLTSLFSNVVLSVRNSTDFSAYTLPKIEDQFPDTGPMGGILSVLMLGYHRIFCVACDMPYLNNMLIEYLCSDTEADAVIPVLNGREEVLHALYTDALIPELQKSISKGRYKLMDAFASANIRFVREDEIRRFDPQGRSFQNVNRPADYEKLED